ncbi:helix-turn-helix domain-containing protein [Deinococcus roseus]|uniref:HTH cro/C1-type domain-containing protein n=1 Tax=Deinococcus roseus TaxID=392414 RepID=A0ABQ2DLF9_9DEIO|nr:helix-turn-helix transcriptional regulator [Deinococcus roseus]GGJ57801.1 hypothetical protein GCM10008938_49880 [Deinococcus roseus]
MTTYRTAEGKHDELAFRKVLGDRIRQIRKAKGMGQDLMAFEAGLHRTHPNMIENAKIDVKLSTLLRIADALGVEVWELLDLTREVHSGGVPGSSGDS